MNTLHFAVTINAPREKVWRTMLDNATYREWASAFMEGSYYQGDWNEGSKIIFLGPDPETGKEAGMVARIKENRPYKFVSMEHYAEISDNVEKPFPDVGLENYSFADKNGGTEVVVELTAIPEEYKQMFEEMWPRALDRLKEIAER